MERFAYLIRRIVNIVLFSITAIFLLMLLYVLWSPKLGISVFFEREGVQIVVLGFLVILFVTLGSVLSQTIISTKTREKINTLEMKEKLELDGLIANLPIGIIKLKDGTQEIGLMSNQAIQFFGRDAKGEQLEMLHPAFQTEQGLIIPEEVEVNHFVLQTSFDAQIHTLKLIDVTEERRLEEALKGRQIVAGYINIDNFDTAVGKTELESNELSFTLNKILGQWFNERGIYIRQYKEERWLIVTELSRLHLLEKERFGILEDVRNFGKSVHVQMSVSGAFASADDFWSATKLSWPLIDLIENRGGDQIIVRDSDGELHTYGGMTQIDAQRTQTRARAMTALFSDVLKEADKVYIMGHKFADADVIGSVLGMKRFCDHQSVDAEIILDWSVVNDEVKKLFNELDGNDRVFTAPNQFDIDSVKGKIVKTIVIDTTIQALVELPELLDVTKVIVIDHHRRGMNSINDTEVSYIEPYASSASELVTEMLQYTPERITLSLAEATMLFYGIIVDSQNFKIKTGKATFSAASYLRDKGADPILLHEITRESFDVFLMRNRLLSYAENLQGSKMLAVSNEEDKIYRREELAKAADTLLEFSDIEVSIVAAKIDENTIGISARSMGEVNVQKLMEQFGGGGHFTAAASQIKDSNLQAVKTELEYVLRRL
ncbi:MAG: DHH family phosphoesterase [Culicoidibacterales bacterium]